MFRGLTIITLILCFVHVKSYVMECAFSTKNGQCMCDLLIYNPTGEYDMVIGGNPNGTCYFNTTLVAITRGLTSNIPQSICNGFTQLQTLEMVNIGLTVFGNNPFRYCETLKKLDLRNNKLSHIDGYTFSNTQLEDINLYNNSLVTLHAGAFDSLRSTKKLNLAYNPGIQLPSAVFDHMVNLTELYLNNCGLNQIAAEWFRYLESLRTLDLSYSKFTTIPTNSFDYVRNLQYLYLQYGQISSLPANIFQYITNLQYLYLHNNQLTSLSSTLFSRQTNLRVLMLSNNAIATIPSSLFGSLGNLVELYLTNCKIKSIVPAMFSSTRSLKILYLQSNEITEIPHGTFTATNVLETLYLTNNDIEKLSARSFGNLQNLYTLQAGGNSINEIDFHFMNQSTRLNAVNYSGNNCTQINVASGFNANKITYFQQMTPCFDHFDGNHIELETYNSTSFDWHNIRPNDGWEGIRVSVQAPGGVQIGLIDTLNRDEPLVEIRLGERDNRESHIFENHEKVFVNVSRLLDENAIKTFVIGWRFGIVMVYSEDERFPFMAHYIRQPFAVNFFGLRSQIEPDFSHQTAIWKVSRIHGNEHVASANAYRAIAAQLKSGKPINLKSFLHQNK